MFIYVYFIRRSAEKSRHSARNGVSFPPGGGTRIASGLELGLQILEQRQTDAERDTSSIIIA